MNTPRPPSGDFPIRLLSPAGLSLQVNANGSIRRMDCRDILLNLFPGTEMEGGPANLYLRRVPDGPAMPLLGPLSPAALGFDSDGLSASGQWGAIRFHLNLRLAGSAPAWFWQVRLENTGATAERLDLIYVQDLGLAEYGAVRTNEFYTSQYVDHTPLMHPQRGMLVASRQNLAMAGRHPWVLIGALGRGTGCATDALQFYGLAARAGLPPVGLSGELGTVRLQHEHSLAALQDESVCLAPGGQTDRGFFGWFEADHRAASSIADLAFADRATGLPEAVPVTGKPTGPGRAPTGTIFTTAPLLDILELTEAEVTDHFGPARLAEERLNGRLLSFFSAADRHVVLRAKELAVLRPHAHLLRTGDRLVPDEASLTSTTWMGGVFHSMVTQGHVAINRFLSSVHGYLGLFRADGMRIFIETAAGWRLLDTPSAFEMTPRSSRWIYKHAGGAIEVLSAAPPDRNALTLDVRILSGAPARLLFACHMAMNGDDGSAAEPVRIERDEEGLWVRPAADSDMDRRFPGGGLRIAPCADTVFERIGGDELLFADNASRRQPFMCMITARQDAVGLGLMGGLIAETAIADGPGLHGEITPRLRIHPPGGTAQTGMVSRFEPILPWFIHNALIHYLAPRGIEQYTGGGWGTRDICQGPVEMLLAMGRFDPVRHILVQVFTAQNPDGDWPQWFMFFDRQRHIRAGDSHGDVVFWPLLALAEYLLAARDENLLAEPVPFFAADRSAVPVGTIREHMARALSVIEGRMVTGTRLAAYGHGDWNDSLQPFDPAMRDRLCSSWTVTLHYQTLVALTAAMDRLGEVSLSGALAAETEGIRLDFQNFLIKDGILAGFASFRADGGIDYLLHPHDRTTGLSYRLLPMIHAVINDLLTPEQARHHLAIIAEHLLGQDGARLFDRSMAYRGGPMRFFQRAESAAFFGREIGLMYTHAHLRYAEALAHYGDAAGFLTALAQANPVGIREIVPAAALRQSNCYYSSSDAAFADRYRAGAEYVRVKKGKVPFEGGWRVYSSGAGIWTSLFLRHFLGLTRQESIMAVDPVIPKTLDGLRVETELNGVDLEVTYHIEDAGCSPTAVSLNGGDLPFTRSPNPYRTGGVQVPMEAVRQTLRNGRNRLVVHLA